MVGGCALHICLNNPDVSEITVVGRRETGIHHEKLHEIIHSDFSDYSAISDTLKNHDVVFYCLGVYTGSCPAEEFRLITVDYTDTFTQALHDVNPKATFCFLSGQGADQTEKSRIAFARYKGLAEKALLKLGFPHTYIFRPGYIYPVTPRKEPNLMYKISRILYPAFRYIYPDIGISSEDLANAMVQVGLYGSDDYGPVLENKDIRSLVKN